MSHPILHYLIVFDRGGMVAEVLEFGEDIKAALASYEEKERQFLDDRSVEVVLVGSDSLDSVRATHPNYFPDKQTANGWLGRLGLSHDVIFGTSNLVDSPLAVEH